MVTMPADYFERPNVASKYDRILYRAGMVLQSPELNEAQIMSNARLKGIADALFRDGAIISGAGILVDPNTGATQLEGGALYLRGAVRGVPAANLTIPVVGTVVVGIWWVESVATELEDPELRDPAVGQDSSGEPGAARLLVTLTWGTSTDAVAGADFFPVHTVVDGVVRPNTPPPDIDAISMAIARYDMQSAGGHYVASGLNVTKLEDLGSGEQVYSMDSGVARVNGREVILPHATRVVYPATPDLKSVVSEPHTAVGGTERVNLNHSPIAAITQVLITKEKTVTIVHGAFSGVMDALPDTPVTQILAVAVGGTWDGSSFAGASVTYAAGADYLLTGDKVDWSPAGAEPAPGTSYQVRYRYTSIETPAAADESGFSVTGAVAGTTILVSYSWKRPRIDRLCLASNGGVVWVQGVANDTEPALPAVPPGLLAVASVRQTWTAARAVSNDGVRTVPMGQLQDMQGQIHNLFALVSDQMLKNQVALSDPVTKRGVFTDPLLDDSKRDAGVNQTAAVFDGFLTLPMENVNVSPCPLADDATLPLDWPATAVVLSQTLRTACMKINPYDAFEPLPASAWLQPASDFWTQHNTIWLSPITRRFAWTERNVVGPTWGLLTRRIDLDVTVLTNTQIEQVRSFTTEAQYLRTINVSFELHGFGPGENLISVKFDGIGVAFTAP